MMCYEPPRAPLLLPAGPVLDQPYGHLGSLGLPCVLVAVPTRAQPPLGAPFHPHQHPMEGHEAKQPPLTISPGQEQPDLFTYEKLLSKELRSALIRTEPHGLTRLPCAMGYQECTFLLAVGVLWWMDGWDAFQLSPYH